MHVAQGLVLSALVSFLLTQSLQAEPGRRRPQAEDAETVTLEQVLEQAGRRPGQTQFINADIQIIRAMAASARGGSLESAQDQSGGDRVVEEHQVYAINPESGELYALSDHRGLIAIGSDNYPEGRLAATGNRPDMMFYQPSRKRLIVIEQDWNGVLGKSGPDQGNDVSASYREVNTVISVIDVSSVNHPVRIETLSLEGHVTDSVKVGSKEEGDILYLTSAVYSDSDGYGWGVSRNPEDKSKGRVTSIDLNKDKLEIVQTVDSALPSVEENMFRIVKRQINGQTCYLAIAVSPQETRDGRWYWRRASQVEVFDVTDPKGGVVKLLQQSVKGNVAKATQVDIVDGSLVVLSNYATDPSDPWRKPWRVAAETFPMPGKHTEAISQVQADARAAAIQAAIESIKDPIDRELAAEKLAAEAATRLAGVAVRTAEGHYTYMFPSSIADVGDTEGQSMTVRDVRFTEELVDGKTEVMVHVVWVPQNEIDPYDVYRLVDGKISFVRRLRYEGWIERLIPFEYENRHFMVGVGWITPAEDRRAQRFPQVKIFERVGSGKDTRIETRAELTLSDAGLYNQMQDRDTLWTPHFDPKTGKGTVLFPVSGYQKDQGSFSGGKVFAFDLAAVVGQKEGALTEGALLLGSTGWYDATKRMFDDTRCNPTNICALSDTKLTVLGSYQEALATNAGLVKAHQTIELARNIADFIPTGGMSIQIVTKGQAWYGDTAAFQVRAVETPRFDGLEHEVQGLVELDGNYEGYQWLENSRTLLVFSSKYVQDEKPEKSGRLLQVSSIQIPKNWSKSSKLTVSKTVEHFSTQEQEQNALNIQTHEFPRAVELNESTFWWAPRYGTQILELRLGEGKTKGSKAPDALEPVKMLGLGELKVPYGSLKRLASGDIALTFDRQLALKQKKEGYSPLQLSRTFVITGRRVAPATLQFDGKPVNIPGGQIVSAALDVSSEGDTLGLVVSGKRTLDLIQETTENDQHSYTHFRVLNEDVLQSVAIWEPTQDVALKDVRPVGELSTRGYRQIGNYAAAVRGVNSEPGYWGPRFGFVPGRFRYRDTPDTLVVDFISIDPKTGELKVESRQVCGQCLTSYPEITSVVEAANASPLLVLRSGNRLQLLRVPASMAELDKSRPTIQPVQLIDEYYEVGEPLPSVVLPGSASYAYYYRGSEDQRPTLTNGTLFLPSGMAGVCAVVLAEEAAKIKAQGPESGDKKAKPKKKADKKDPKKKKQ